MLELQRVQGKRISSKIEGSALEYLLLPYNLPQCQEHDPQDEVYTARKTIIAESKSSNME